MLFFGNYHGVPTDVAVTDVGQTPAKVEAQMLQLHSRPFYTHQIFLNLRIQGLEAVEIVLAIDVQIHVFDS